MGLKEFAIGLKIVAHDAVSPTFTGIEKNLSGFQNKLVKSQSTVSAYLDKQQGKQSSGFGKILGGVALGTLASNGITAAASKIKELASTGLELASDLSEVQNVVDTTFGAGSKKIDAWSKTAITQFGLGQLAAKKYTSTIGAMMKSSGISSDKLVEMSQGVAGLAGDFASFYNLDTEDAFEKIRSGISGETMPLKQLGINMSEANLQAFALTQGITKQVSKMSQAQQTTLRYNYLMTQSKDAQGDFNKTLATSYANQKRVLQTKIASTAASAMSAVLPVVMKYTTKLNEVVTKIGDWIGKNKELVGTKLDQFMQSGIKFLEGMRAPLKIVIDLIGALGPNGIMALGIFIGTIKLANTGLMIYSSTLGVVGKAMKLFETITFAVSAVTKGAATAQEGLNMVIGANPIGLAVKAVALLAVGFVLLYKNCEPFHDFVNSIGPFASRIFSGIGTFVQNTWNGLKGFFSGFAKGISDSIKSPLDVLKMYIFTIADVISTVLGGIAKGTLGVASAVGKAVGINTSGLDKSISDISAFQKNIRSQSLIGVAQNATVSKAVQGNKPATSKTTSKATSVANPAISKAASVAKPAAAGKTTLNKTATSAAPRTALGASQPALGASVQVVKSSSEQYSEHVERQEVTIKIPQAPKGTRVEAKKPTSGRGVNVQLGLSGSMF